MSGVRIGKEGGKLSITSEGLCVEGAEECSGQPSKLARGPGSSLDIHLIRKTSCSLYASSKLNPDMHHL